MAQRACAESGVSPRAWWLFLALGVIWGIPYLLIRIAVADVPPVFVAFARTAIGALILLPIATVPVLAAGDCNHVSQSGSGIAAGRVVAERATHARYARWVRAGSAGILSCDIAQAGRAVDRVNPHHSTALL
jgi:hypothetical protein